VTFIFVVTTGVLVPFLFSAALKMRPRTVTFLQRKKQAMLSLVVFATSFLATFGIYGFYDKIWVRVTLTADPLYVLRAAIATFILLAPTIVALRFSRQGLIDVALTQQNLGKNVAFGGLTSILLVFVLGVASPNLGGRFAGFSVATIFLLLSYIVVAFGEELVFRGYIQTRLVANNGALVGVGAASLLYALYNVPSGFFCFGGDIGLALVYGAWRISTGLVYGYIFHRSQSIVPSIIVHIFLAWGGLLFSLYL
jgi:membrane protease YdiL (CAAX protease family)